MLILIVICSGRRVLMKICMCYPQTTDDGRTVLTGDGGDIKPEYQWEETIDVDSD